MAQVAPTTSADLDGSSAAPRKITKMAAASSLRSGGSRVRVISTLFGTRANLRSPAVVSEEFKKQTRSISAQLKQRDRDRVFVIDPRGSSILSLWDFITMSALLYTALLTPFEVGFLPATSSVDMWFIVNRVIDFIFVADMVLQFFVVYQSVSGGSEQSALGDTAWVTERDKIIRHYLYGWFPLDVISILPSAFDVIPLLLRGDGTASAAEKLSGFRAIRALRLIKLVRLIRASRLLQRWRARMGVSHSTMTIFKIIGFITITCHWYACIFALQAMLHDDPAVTWLGLQGHCHEVPIAQRLLDEPLLAAHGRVNMSADAIFNVQCANLDLPTFYLASFSWSAMIVTGLGGTDWYPSQDNPETAIVTGLVIFGALMWAKVLATFCDLATNSDPSSVEYRQALDDLNRFCRDAGLSSELKQRLRQFFIRTFRSGSNPPSLAPPRVCVVAQTQPALPRRVSA